MYLTEQEKAVLIKLYKGNCSESVVNGSSNSVIRLLESKGLVDVARGEGGGITDIRILAKGKNALRELGY
ncbi:MAG: hypothetical protein LBQ73_09670 [Tannerellaceae bacterium]|jgi:hypothetical protein|nr:hypothetical protein [Tannerellaceae bacterium]